VNGPSVTVSGKDSHNLGSLGLQFKLEGANLGPEETSAPYSVTLNTTTLLNGAHTLSAVVLRDDLIELQTPVSRNAYPVAPRRIVALVEVDGREMEMVFLTNNLEWSAASIVELYRCRWQIEVFFKQIKQTLQLADFLGTTANAVRWQVWTALLVYLLLRYLAFLSNWSHSFSRLFTLLRAALWQKWDLLGLLRCYGTADGHFRYLARPEQAYLPGLGIELWDSPANEP